MSHRENGLGLPAGFTLSPEPPCVGRAAVPVASTFVNYPGPSLQSNSDNLRATRRSRSAPLRSILVGSEPRLKTPEERVGGRSLTWKQPKGHTRKDLEELGVEELVGVAHAFGLKKLGDPDDKRLAERWLPLPPHHANQPTNLHRFERYLEDISWDQLILLLRQLARKRVDQLAGGQRSMDSARDAHYLEEVCDALLKAQLRDAQPPTSSCSSSSKGGESVMPWRMAKICRNHGLHQLWEEVTRRLGCGSMLVLTARPVPLLDEELRHIKRLVHHCFVLSVASEQRDLERLAFSCDVLYVAGMHDPALVCLQKLRDLRASLVILNVCRSEKLAKHLLSRGVRHVTYWPAAVHDPEACAFGVSLVENLSRLEIADAFAAAQRGLCPNERAPLLLSLDGAGKNGSQLMPANVVLEARGHSGRFDLAGRHAQVLRHTAWQGWVKVRVEKDVVSWRVGHWREAQPNATDQPCKEDALTPSAVPTPPLHVVGSERVKATSTTPIGSTSLSSSVPECMIEQHCPATLLDDDDDATTVVDDEEIDQREQPAAPTSASFSEPQKNTTANQDCADTLEDQDTQDEDWLRELCWGRR